MDQFQQLKASYAELRTTLTAECEHSADVHSLLVAERQIAASAKQQCSVLSERLAEMERTFSDSENSLDAVLYMYVMLSLGHFVAYIKMHM